MLGRTHGTRSATVCHWKCDDACAKPVPNTTDNPLFADVLRQVVARRTVLAGSAAAAFTVGVAGSALPAAAAPGVPPRARSGRLDFTPIAPVPADVDAVTVPAGFDWSTIIAWGDPVAPGAPEFDADAQTPEKQAMQFGYNNDYLDILTRSNGRRGLLVANHEYTNDEIMFPDFASTDPEVQVRNIRTSMFAHGMSVVEVERRGRFGAWTAVRDGRLNRRIHVETEFAVDGPAAGSDLLKTVADPTGTRVLGTLNNCAGGTTPWGTVLSGEENAQQYFRAATTPSAEERRYGLTSGSGRGWYRADPRFDLRAEGYRNEPNRHFWIVEVDPDDPTSTPVKHTAMGRFKHEGAVVRVGGSGHVVAYMGDDETFDYVYKFVSRNTVRRGTSPAARRQNRTLLSEGDLFVARFDGEGDFTDGFDGSGTWLPLVVDGVSHVPGMSVEEVLVYTRIAGDRVGATKMDRPEEVEPSPTTGHVYIACTNNRSRDGRVVRGEVADADATNPRSPNKDGHVVELIEDGNDVRARTFTWNLLLVCGDPDDTSIPTYFGGYDGPVSPISCPDNLAFDQQGNLWVSTDGQPGAIGYNDALHLVPVTGPDRGRVQQFMAVPTGAETCGPIVDSVDGSVLIAVQHPGDTDDATYESPSSLFPYDGVAAIPRPGCIHIYRTS
ncbi:PhoX family protein [Aquipuribacter sp. MA13-13]